MLESLLACDITDFASMNLEGEALAVLIVGAAMVFAVLSMVIRTFRSIVVGRAREASRREIAAYVAEGTMTADEAERLLNAGRPNWERWHC